MGSRPRLHGGRLFAGMTRGWVPASARTRVGMGSRPCLHGGRLFAGIDEGMGPRIREDKGGGWGMGSRPCLHGGRLIAGMTRGWVPASARTRVGVGDGFPSLSSWGKALRGHDEGMGPRIREDKSGDGFPSLSSWGQALRGYDEGMGPRIREDKSGGRLHPHPSLPPSRGRKKRGDGSPHPRGHGRGWGKWGVGQRQVKGEGAASSGGFLRR